MADRILVLHGGVVQQYDTPEQVYERPSNQFVASFIGSPAMNFFGVELNGEEIVLTHDRRVMPLNHVHRARLRNAGGRGVLGIRPEHFAISADAEGIPAAAIKLVEPLSSDTMVHFDIAEASGIARIEPTVKPSLGDKIALSLPASKVHLFDADSG